MQTLTKTIRRKTCQLFLHYGYPLSVELVPGDYLRLKLLRHKREVYWDLHDLYFAGVKRDVAKEKRERQAKRRKK